MAPETRQEAAGGRFWPLQLSNLGRASPGRVGRPSTRAGRRPSVGHGGVVSIDITTCAHCGGAVRIVASIEEPTAIRAIRAILAHFEKHGALEQAHYRPAARAPPPAA